jgi:hypothetical protein
VERYVPKQPEGTRKKSEMNHQQFEAGYQAFQNRPKNDPWVTPQTAEAAQPFLNWLRSEQNFNNLASQAPTDEAGKKILNFGGDPNSSDILNFRNCGVPVGGTGFSIAPGLCSKGGDRSIRLD